MMRLWGCTQRKFCWSSHRHVDALFFAYFVYLYSLNEDGWWWCLCVSVDLMFVCLDFVWWSKKVMIEFTQRTTTFVKNLICCALHIPMRFAVPWFPIRIHFYALLTQILAQLVQFANIVFIIPFTTSDLYIQSCRWKFWQWNNFMSICCLFHFKASFHWYHHVFIQSTYRMRLILINVHSNFRRDDSLTFWSYLCHFPGTSTDYKQSINPSDEGPNWIRTGVQSEPESFERSEIANVQRPVFVIESTSMHFDVPWNVKKTRLFLITPGPSPCGTITDSSNATNGITTDYSTDNVFSVLFCCSASLSIWIPRNGTMRMNLKDDPEVSRRKTKFNALGPILVTTRSMVSFLHNIRHKSRCWNRIWMEAPCSLKMYFLSMSSFSATVHLTVMIMTVLMRFPNQFANCSIRIVITLSDISMFDNHRSFNFHRNYAVWTVWLTERRQWIVFWGWDRCWLEQLIVNELKFHVDSLRMNIVFSCQIQGRSSYSTSLYPPLIKWQVEFRQSVMFQRGSA